MRKERPRDMQEGRSLRMLHGVGLGAGMGAEGHMAPQGSGRSGVRWVHIPGLK